MKPNVKYAGIVLCCITTSAFLVQAKANSEKAAGTAKAASFDGIYINDGYPVDIGLVSASDASFTKNATMIPSKKNPNEMRTMLDWKTYSKVKLGTKVFLDSSEGRIVRLSGDVDYGTGMYSATVLFNEAPQPAPFHHGRIEIGRKSHIISVPNEVLQAHDGKHFAWIMNAEDKAAHIQVQIGLRDGYNSEVLSGLSDGDKLITSDVKQLTDGRLLKAASKE